MKISTNIRNKTVGKVVAILLFSAFLMAPLFSQSTWTGGAGTTNWNTPGNWTGGVPAAGKTVTIFTCSTCPIINTAGAQAAFVQVYAGGKLTINNGGGLTISNPGGPGMKTHATSQVTLQTGAALTIQNFWGEGLAVGGTFSNNGTVNINGGHTGIAVSAGATLSNHYPTGIINVTGASLNYGLTSSGTVSNTGLLTLDDANNDGISQNAGVMNLDGVVNITKTGVNAIFSKASINNSGSLNITNGLNGIFVLTGGLFNNQVLGKIAITGTTFLNTGIYNFPGTFKNFGDLTITNALSKGIENSGGASFENSGRIILNNTGFSGIFNVGGATFTNKPCARIESTSNVVNWANFINKGILKAPGGGGSTINVNDGALLGNFMVGSGNQPINESGVIVWTGCQSTDFADAFNWFPNTLPVAGQYTKAIVQNVAQASANAPRVSTAITSAPLYLHVNAGLTVANGGSLSLSDGMLGNGYLEVRFGALMTVAAGGTFSSSSVSILGGSIQNSGSFNITAPFHSAGTFGMNSGTFNNLAGGTFTGTVGQAGSGVNAGLSNGATFINSGAVTIGGFGGFFLNQSTLNNFASGTIAMPSGGRISNLNGSAVINNGSIGINRQSPEGIRCESSTFTNGGSILLSFTNILQYGGTFTNTGSISIVSPSADGIINGGTFSSSGNIGVQQSGTHHGILNLSGATFSTGAGSLNVFDHTSNGIINFGNFSNGGKLDINTTNYARGIESQGSFVNQTTGIIIIKNTVGEGLVSFNTFSNHGSITVENISTQDGIATGGFFENSIFGNITVNNVGEAGIWVFGGTCNNSGQISTNQTSTEGVSNGGNFTNTPTGSIVVKNATGAALTNSSLFTNQPCATVNIDQILVNTSTFLNKGLLKTTATGQNQNTSSFINTGVIEDFNGSFNGVPFTNNTVRVRPINGQIGGFIQNALEIGISNSFQIGTTWFLNANLTNPGGSYIPGVNTFTPTVGVGSHTMYFTAKDLANNCTKTVSVQVNIASLLKNIGSKPEPDILLMNYPNPFVEETAIKFSLPFDAEGKLVIYDNFGRLVETIHEGAFLKDELYEFPFDASGARVSTYVASLVLTDGRVYSIRLLKGDNR